MFVRARASASIIIGECSHLANKRKLRSPIICETPTNLFFCAASHEYSYTARAAKVERGWVNERELALASTTGGAAVDGGDFDNSEDYLLSFWWRNIILYIFMVNASGGSSFWSIDSYGCVCHTHKNIVRVPPSRRHTAHSHSITADTSFEAWCWFPCQFLEAFTKKRPPYSGLQLLWQKGSSTAFFGSRF
jgi:hypothetical protein